MSQPIPTARYVVDRREGKLLVLETPDGGTINLPASHLPANCRAEGAILDVPLSEIRTPVWAKAIRNRKEEERRLRDAKAKLEHLRRTDPGGDVSL